MDKGFTHAGVFHADDVFATALLEIVYPEIEIIRGFCVPHDFEGIVYDIGMGEYDHHQPNPRLRADGTPYAAFGLLWRVYGKVLLGEENARWFDEIFVAPLDYSDNTGASSPLSFAVGCFNPPWDSKKSEEDCFREAVEWAKIILKKEIALGDSEARAEKIVTEALKNSSEEPVVILEKYVPWKKYLIPTEKKYCIYPSKRGGWNAQAVPTAWNTQDTKSSFPDLWRKASKEELENIDEELLFCHSSGFLISTKSREAAIRLCIRAEKMEE